MARTRVRLAPVPSPGSVPKPITVRTALSGHFIFTGVPDGLYLITAIRDHYFPASYGQRLPHGQGTPLQVTADADIFAELRMHRMGAVTGRVLDENGIGLSDVNVVAYRTRLPLRIAASAVSDDRGVYRIHGLDPGKYWVRTGPLTLDDGSTFVPTFAPESIESRDARAFVVAVDGETPDADLRIIPGRLANLTITLQCQPMGMMAIASVASETGRSSANISCGDSHRFDGLAPGPYEISAQTQDNTQFGFTELMVNHDQYASVLMAPPPRMNIVFEGVAGTAGTNPSITLLARQQSLAETGPEREIKPPQTTLAPGHWEIRARTQPGVYVDAITDPYSGIRRPFRIERPSDRFDIFVESRFQASIRVRFSDKAAAITGAVQTDGKPVAGVPVFLWPVAEQARRSLGGAVQTLSDVNGQFDFESLPPGDYRLLATFDLNEVDQESMDLAQAATIHVEPSQQLQIALKPWIGPY